MLKGHRDNFMRFIIYFVAFLVSLYSSATCETSVHDRLYHALKLDEIAEILHKEGIEDGLKAGKAYLGQKYNKEAFGASIANIYSIEKIENGLKAELSELLPSIAAEHALDFYDSDLGRRIAALEASARKAISDSAIESMAISAAKSARKDDPQRFKTLQKGMEVLSLIDLNMSGAFSAQFAFLTKLSQSDNFALSHSDILTLLIERESEMRAEILDWLMGFSYMAYKPLTDQELDIYFDFLSSSYGKVLNKSLFDVFNEFSVRTSGDLASKIISFQGVRDL